MKRHTTRLTLATLLLSSFGALSVSAQTCVPAGADIAAWWDGDSIATGAAYDLTGQSALLGSVSTAAAVVDDGLYFDGTTAHVLSTNEPLLNSLDSMTIECWVTLDPSTIGSTTTIIAEVGIEPGTPEGQYALRVLTTGRVQFLRKTGPAAQTCAVATSTNVVPVGIPTHIVAMWGQDSNSDNNIEVWVNNVRSGYTNLSHFDIQAPLATRVGETSPGVSLFHGTIDELIVHKRALADSEIGDSFFASVNGHCKDCAPRESQISNHWTADSQCEEFILDDEGGVALLKHGTSTDTTGFKGSSFATSNGAWYGANGPALSTSGDFTVECWMRADGPLALRGVLSEFGVGAPVEGQWALRTQSNNSLTFWRLTGDTNCNGTSACADTVATLGNAITPGRWHHVAVSYSDANAFTIFIDGELQVPNYASSHVSLVTPIDFQIGAYGGASQFQGSIDEVSLFRRECTPSEIITRYEAGSLGVCDTTNPLPCHLGDDVDFRLTTQVNGFAYANAPQKTAYPDDVLSLSILSPNGGYVGGVPVIAVDFLPADSDVPSYPGAPGLHITAGTMLLFNGLKPSSLGFTLLPASGMDFNYVIPSGLQGMMARFQAVIYAPTRSISNSQDVEFR